jgi:hypothetical protein
MMNISILERVIVSNIANVVHDIREAAIDVSKLITSTIKAHKQSDGTLSTVNEQGPNLWWSMNEDTAHSIFSFLDARDVCALQCVDMFFKRVVLSLGNTYWKAQLAHRFNRVDLVNCVTSFKRHYISCHVHDSFTEYMHFQSVYKLYRSMSQYHRTGKRGIIGMVCDVAWVDNELLSQLLSRKRYMTMRTIITYTVRDVHEFKSATKNYSIEPTAFMPLHSQTSPHNDDTNMDPLYNVVRQGITYPGFIGYAINLIRLREQHEYLRYNAFWGMFRDLMVFETNQDVVSYSSTLDPQKMEDFWAVSLEDYSQQELNDTFPRFSAIRPRETYFLKDISHVAIELETRLQNARHSDAVMIYS